MKTILLPLCFLLLASTLTLLPDAVHASENDHPVLDTKGNGILPGISYYLISNQWPLGGGIVSLGKGKNETCPTDVTLLENLCSKGTPVTFSTASGEFFITDSTDLYISFDATSNCTNKSMLWKHERTNETSTEFLTIGGVEGDVNTIFRVVSVGGTPFGSNYKLVAYTLSSHALLLSTSDVGVEFDFTTGIRRLALTEPPLIVSFEVAVDYDIGLLKQMV